MPYLFLLFLVVFMAGCATRGPTPEQKQAAADASAGVEALVPAPRTQATQLIVEGVLTNVEGAVGALRKDWPRPRLNAQQITKVPDAYVEQAKKGRDDILDQIGSSWWTWAAGGALTLLGVLKFIPGAHQPIVSVLQGLLENSVDRQSRKREEQLAQGARVMMDQIEKMGNGAYGSSISKLKQKIAAALPASAGDAVKEYLASK